MRQILICATYRPNTLFEEYGEDDDQTVDEFEDYGDDDDKTIDDETESAFEEMVEESTGENAVQEQMTADEVSAVAFRDLVFTEEDDSDLYSNYADKDASRMRSGRTTTTASRFLIRISSVDMPQPTGR